MLHGCRKSTACTGGGATGFLGRRFEETTVNFPSLLPSVVGRSSAADAVEPDVASVGGGSDAARGGGSGAVSSVDSGGGPRYVPRPTPWLFPRCMVQAKNTICATNPKRMVINLIIRIVCKYPRVFVQITPMIMVI